MHESDQVARGIEAKYGQHKRRQANLDKKSQSRAIVEALTNLPALREWRVAQDAVFSARPTLPSAESEDQRHVSLMSAKGSLSSAILSWLSVRFWGKPAEAAVARVEGFFSRRSSRLQDLGRIEIQAKVGALVQNPFDLDRASPAYQT